MISLLLLLALAGLMHATDTYVSTTAAAGTELAFGFLLLTAYFGGSVIGSLRMPRLTGYLLAGVIVGPAVLGLVTTDTAASLDVVNGVASCVLGLTAGAELNLKRVRPLVGTLRGMMMFGVLGGVVCVAALLFVMRPLLPLFDGVELGPSIAVCVLIAVALIPQSPAVVMAVLSEVRAEGPLSQTMIASVVVADLFVIILFAVASAITGVAIGGELDLLGTAGHVAWELLGSMAFGILIGIIIGAFLRAATEGRALFVLMICVVVALISTRVQLDPLVVMLGAGIWLENFSKSDTHALLAKFESAQLPVFLVWFALAGLKLDLVQLWASLLPVLLIVVVRAAALFAGTRVGVSASAPPAVKRSGWIALVPQAGLSLAFAVVIRNSYPSFGPEASVILLSVLAINQLVPPVLLRRALVQSGEAGQKTRSDLSLDHQ